MDVLFVGDSMIIFHNLMRKTLQRISYPRRIVAQDTSFTTGAPLNKAHNTTFLKNIFYSDCDYEQNTLK